MCANFPEKDNKLHFNGCSDRKLVLSDPSAFGVIYLHDYFHNFTYFIEFIMTFFSKTLKLVVATLHINGPSPQRVQNQIMLPCKLHDPRLVWRPMVSAMDHHQQYLAVVASNVYKDLLYLHRLIAFWLAKPQKRGPQWSKNISENTTRRKLGSV